MTSLTQHIARCYLSHWKTCQKAKLRLLSIMIYRLRNYRLTSKKYSESLTCDYEDLDSWLLRKKQPHIDEKELKRKNKRNASRSFESTDIRWYVGVVLLSVYHCSLHLYKFKFLVIFSRCKCTCCSSDAVTMASERVRKASAVTSEIDR